MQFSLPVISLIGYLPLFSMVKPPMLPFQIMCLSLRFLISLLVSLGVLCSSMFLRIKGPNSMPGH
ncbi:hypothetical protein RchiOBHm_Chr7g0198221 [Rosa chinensis]|uniref:Uncharacterized protein n=1 Tax=Rosa chinensis TaxID=74649 RepID=A0A2P6P720_ROSCH|nr:hypothetical protein RchiOBHm_Chr7g0198221 [Rosa chinensis]